MQAQQPLAAWHASHSRTSSPSTARCTRGPQMLEELGGSQLRSPSSSRQIHRNLKSSQLSVRALKRRSENEKPASLRVGARRAAGCSSDLIWGQITGACSSVMQQRHAAASGSCGADEALSHRTGWFCLCLCTHQVLHDNWLCLVFVIWTPATLASFTPLGFCSCS